MRKLFLLEDDLSLISGLTFAFKKQGFALDTARTLAEAEVLWSDRKYDLLVLDVSLPDGSGFDFCQKVRRTSNVPILFLTASDEEMNIIMGLELGGDDYLTKPFKLGVLLSRVNALLRRANSSSAGEPVLESGSITVRLLQGQAYKNGVLLELTGAEYKLLCFFMQHPNAVLSKEQILDALWDCDGEMSFTMICQFPFLFSWFEVSIRIAISAILNTAVTRNTARTMHKIVMRFCRLRTLAEIGIRLR